MPIGEETISAVHHEGESETWFVCCHGLKSDKAGSYERRCNRALEAGYNAVRFDFRGCGDSDGAFVDSTLSARLADLEAVLEYFDPDSCVLFGSSFGGTVAFHAARTFAASRVEAVVTRAPVTYTRALENYQAAIARDGEVVFEDGDRLDERFSSDLERYDFADVARDLEVPVVLVHGLEDESVPVSDSRDAARAIDGDVLLQTLSGEGHLFSPAAERQLLAVTFAWLEAIAATRA